MYNFRTDLALERTSIYRKANKVEQRDGIETEEQDVTDKIKVSRVKITNENGEQAIGKPKGVYTTIDLNELKIAQDEDIQKASEVLSEELKHILDNHISKQDDILVVGLGNIYVTPDALRTKGNK